ncbi:hypothetical protein DFS34DRAFT_133303 [Phlyctochytrium arcticum]|nr:hypothetical protein DFS34DRAFT_133303 [Phlyctochytrium arcticum]
MRFFLACKAKCCPHSDGNSCNARLIVKKYAQDMPVHVVAHVTDRHFSGWATLGLSVMSSLYKQSADPNWVLLRDTLDGLKHRTASLRQTFITLTEAHRKAHEIVIQSITETLPETLTIPDQMGALDVLLRAVDDLETRAAGYWGAKFRGGSNPIGRWKGTNRFRRKPHRKAGDCQPNCHEASPHPSRTSRCNPPGPARWSPSMDLQVAQRVRPEGFSTQSLLLRAIRR